MTTDPNLRTQIDRDNGIIDIRQSAYAAFLDCRNRYRWEYGHGLEPDYPDTARPMTTADVGTLLHTGMEAYYTGEPIEKTMFATLTDLGVDPLDPDVISRSELASIMVAGHISDLEEDGADIGESTVAIEEPGISTIHDVRGWTVRVHYKVDRRIETEDGQNIIDDTKSVDRFMPIDNYLPQLMRYAMLVRNESGWRADRIRTTQVRRVKRTKDGPFYQRVWVPATEEMYRVAAINLRAGLTDLVRAIETDGPWYEHRTGECSWKCRVEDLCQAQVRGDDVETLVEIHYREKGSA